MDYLQINELYHWGIKGQKWGIRNYRNEDGTLTAAGKARYNDDGSRKKSKNMSDEDLAKSNKRLQMEQQYDMLSETNAHKKVVSGLKNAKKIGASVAGSFLVSFGAATAAQAISKNTISLGRDAVGKSLLIAGLASASALVTGVVSANGGNVTRTPYNAYFSNQPDEQQAKKQK